MVNEIEVIRSSLQRIEEVLAENTKQLQEMLVIVKDCQAAAKQHHDNLKLLSFLRMNEQ